jgi:hypothetical protein
MNVLQHYKILSRKDTANYLSLYIPSVAIACLKAEPATNFLSVPTVNVRHNRQSREMTKHLFDLGRSEDEDYDDQLSLFELRK